MATFAVAFVLFTGALLVISVPVVFLARRRGRSKTARRFLIAAGAVGLICAIVSAGSERLEGQCQTAGNPNCYDFGGTGLQFLLVAGYIISALTKALALRRD